MWSDLGQLQVLTGNGKGKTTAALGLAVRAACAGIHVYIGQFLKGSDTSELALPGHFPEYIRIEQFGLPELIGPGEPPREGDIASARRGLARLSEVLHSGECGLVVADELCIAVHMGLVPEADAVAFIDGRPAGVELVLTGRHAPQSILDRADLVTEMREVKHYYALKGLQARKGIEF